jgi:PAS domain S-box-containing protein
MNLRLLLLEDNPSDAELALAELRIAGYEPDWKRVETESDFLAALDPSLDLILADYNLPQFNGVTALRLMRERGLDIPFILVSGIIGEEKAVEAMKQGAADYVIKDRIARLGQAVTHALEDKRLQREKREVEESLRRRAEEFAALYEIASEIAGQSDFPDLLDTIIARVAKLLGVPGGGIYLFEEATNSLRVVASTHEKIPIGVTLQMGEGMAGRVAESRQPLIVNDYSQWPHRSNRYAGIPFRAVIEVPMLYRGALVGVLVAYGMDDATRQFDEADVRLLSLLASSVAGAINNARELAARKQAEEKYRNIFENAVEAITQTTPEGRYITANPATARILGYDSVEELMSSVNDLNTQFYVEPGRREEFKKLIEEQGFVVGFESEVYRKDGSRVWVSENMHAVRDEQGNLLYYEGASEDITKRKKAEEAVKSSERRLSALVANGLDFISLLDAQGNLLWESPSTNSLLGYRFNEFLGRNILELAHPEDLEWVQRQLAELAAAPGSRQSGVFRMKRADGEYRWIEAVASNFLDDPAVNAIVINYRDITERIEAEGKLRLQSAALEASANSIIISNREGFIQWANPAFTALTGYKVPDEVFGRNPRDLVKSGKQDQRFYENLWNTILAGKIWHGELVNQRKDGSLYDEEMTITPVKDENGAITHFITVKQDITARKHHERQLEAQAMLARALGESLELQSLLERLLEAARHAIPAAEKGGVLLLEADGRLRVRALNGYTDPRLKDFAFASDSGYSARAARERQPVLIRDARADPEIRYDGEIEEARQIHGAIAVPLLIQERVIGVLSLDSTQKGAFTQEDLNRLVSFAASAALVIQNARLFEEIQARLQELEILQSLSSALRQAHTVEEMLPLFIQRAAQAAEADAGSIYLWEEASGAWVSQGWMTADGRWQTDTASLRHRPGQGVTGWVGERGEIYVTTDWRADPTNQPLPHEVEFIQSLTSGISLPLKAEARVIGVMHLWYADRHGFREDEKRLLTAIADMAGNAIQRARLHDETAQQVKRLSALRSIDSAIASSFDVQVTLRILLDHLTSLLRVDAAAILLFNAGLTELEFAAGKGFRSNSIFDRRIKLGEKYSGQAALERRSIFVHDIRADPVFHRSGSIAGEDFVSFYAIPLLAKGHLKGALEIFQRSPLEPGADWLDFLQTLAGQAAIAIDDAQMFGDLQRSNLNLTLAYDATIAGWSQAMDLRDKETEGHTQRVTDFTVRLAERMGIPAEKIVHIRRGALLHDIGKLGVPDHILLKPDKLTEEEWEMMRKHPVFAYEMLSPIEFLHPALDIPYCHHERWDGTGYPRGLKGEQIPLAARLFAVVDVWDALRSDRPYRAAWPEDKVREHLLSLSGTHFEPRIAEMFMSLLEER